MYVALVDEKVVASGKNAKVVLDIAKTRYPEKEIVLRKIPEERLFSSEFPWVEKGNIVPKILRPIARVKLIYEGNETTLDMYIDSGSDITLIPYSVGIN